MGHRIGWNRRRGGVFAVGAIALIVAATVPAWSQPGSSRVERPAAVAFQVDADPTVSISASDPSASEPGANTGTFTITRTGDLAQALAVGFVVEGTATAGTDYTTLTSPVTIPASSTTATLTVTPRDDSADEPDETVIVTITAPTGYAIGASSRATVTIADDDLPVVTVTASDPTAAESGGDGGAFTVTREGVTTGPLTVTYTVSGTATPDVDYTKLTGSVEIATGQKSAVIPVAPISDDIDEAPETVILTLADGTAYDVGSPAQATVTIADDDLPTVAVRATDPKADEDGLEPGAFTVSRIGDTSGPLTVDYTVTGTATAGSDYSALSGSVTIAANKTTAVIPVTPLDDSIDENDETVTVTIAARDRYRVGTPASATVTIEDNDAPTPRPTPISTPTGTMPSDKDACKQGGWMSFGVFKNQGDCVSWVATGGKNPPALGAPPAGQAAPTTPATPGQEPRTHPGKGKGLGKKK